MNSDKRTREGEHMDERTKILKLVEDGRISASEAASLLSALNVDRRKDVSVRQPKSSDARWFRIKITDLVTGRAKTTVNIPMSLMDWGLRIGAQFSPEVADVDLDEISEILRSGANGKIVEVIDEEDGEHVEIYVE